MFNNRKIKSKKGQLYILAAVLICAALVGVFSIAVQTKYDAKSVELTELCSHYKSESDELINSIIKEKGDVSGNYNNFAKNYYYFGKSISYNFGFLFVLTYQNITFVRNYLDLPVNMSVDGNSFVLYSYPNGQYERMLSKPKSVSFIYANNLYNFSIIRSIELDSVCIFKKNKNDLTIVTW